MKHRFVLTIVILAPWGDDVETHSIVIRSWFAHVAYRRALGEVEQLVERCRFKFGNYITEWHLRKVVRSST